MYPVQRWRLMNYLWNQTTVQGFRILTNVAHEVGADGDDLIALEDQGLIKATKAGEKIRMDTDLNLAGRAPADFDLGPNHLLRLTRRGLAWVEGADDADQHVLWVFGHIPTAPKTPLHLLIRHGLLVDALVECVNGGLIEAVNADTGRPCTGGYWGNDIEAACRRPPELDPLVAHLTRKGISIVFPERGRY